MAKQTLNLDNTDESKQVNSKTQVDLEIFVEQEKILCNHCLRTYNNGKRCIGMCVADSEY